MKFKEVIHFIGIFFFFITILLGGLLLTGDPLEFIAIGILLSFALYYLIKLILNKKEETHPKQYHIIILLTIYSGIAVFGGLYSLHFLTIHTTANNDLRINGNEKIETIINMKTEFKESVEDLRNDLSDDLSTNLERFLYSTPYSSIRSTSKAKLINTYKFSQTTLGELNSSNIDKTTSDWIKYNITYKIDLFNNKIDKELNAYLATNKNVFNDMDYFSLNKVYYELDSFLINNKNELEEGFMTLSNEFDKSNIAFNSLIMPSNNVELNSLSGLRSQYNILRAIIMYIIIHLLILFPIIVTNNKFKKPKPKEDIVTTPIP